MGGCGPAARHHPPPRSSSCRNTWRFFWDEFGGLLLPAAFLGRQPGSPYKTAFLKGLLGGGSSTTPQNCSPEEGRKQSANAHGFQGRKWAQGWCEEQENGGGSECKVGMRTLIPSPETPMHTSSSMPLSEQLHAFSGSLQSVGLSKLRNWGQTLGNWGQQPRNWDGNPRTGMETGNRNWSGNAGIELRAQKLRWEPHTGSEVGTHKLGTPGNGMGTPEVRQQCQEVKWESRNQDGNARIELSTQKLRWTPRK